MIIIDRVNISEYIRNIFSKYYELNQKKYIYLLKEALVKYYINNLSSVSRREIIKGGGSRCARDPGCTGLKELYIKLSISKKRSSKEHPSSSGIGILKFFSIGNGPNCSESENHLLII